MVRVLIVDDDAEIGALLCAALARHGLQAEHQLSGEGLLKRLARGDVDVLVLDRMLPGDDGLTLCGVVRQRFSLPILMLTAMGDSLDRVVGLYGGADDYVVKPFDAAELVARVKVLMRRQSGEARQEAWQFAGWTLKVSQRELQRADGLVVPLSGAEFRLLMCLLQHWQVQARVPEDRLRLALAQAAQQAPAELPAALTVAAVRGYAEGHLRAVGHDGQPWAIGGNEVLPPEPGNNDWLASSGRWASGDRAPAL